jgi:hypothetical protein
MKTALAKPESRKTNADLRPQLSSEGPRCAGSCGASAGLPVFLQHHGCACPECTARVQAKLVVGQSGDGFEQQADRVADAAISGDVQRKPVASVPAQFHGASGNALPAADSGAPLNPDLRQRLEPALGADLGPVRVHSSPADRDLAHSLGAQAFTHGRHIWLGHSQSAGDVRLMAHEAAHVVQQGAARPGAAPDVQRREEDKAASAKPDDAVLHSMLKELPKAGDKPAAATPGKPDPATLAHKKAELQDAGKPAVDQANQGQPHLQATAHEAKKEAARPAKQAGEEKAPAKSKAPAKGKGKEKGGGKAPAHAKGAVPAGHQAPPTPQKVRPPNIAVPVDAAGKPLMPDPAGDAAIAGMLAMAQAMRMQGSMLRERAAQERHNAGIIQGNMAKVHEGISQADEGIAKSEDHLAYRREAAGQAEGALHVSEEKADKVAAEAPKYQSKSVEGKAKSGPMSGEAKGLASQNSSQAPDDPDAAAKSREQGQKIGSVGSDIGSMDDAITQTGAKADGLAGEAAQAKQKNAQTKQNITGTQATLDQTGAKLTQMSGQSSAAQQQLAAQAGGPAQMAAGAASLDQQGQAAIQASIQMEERVHASQQKYLDGMRSVPASKRGKPVLVQRQPEPGRIDLNLAGKVGNALPEWLTGEEKQTEEQRAEAEAAEKKRRADEVKEINDKAGGDFSKLSAADKAGIALSLTGRHLFGSVAGIKWPNFLGKMAQGLVDPRMALMGIVSGLSMILSGGANLFSAAQWKKDPLGNLLKSAADIATGITIVLGSITALAMAIIAILVAAAILTLGALGPVAAAVIPFCWTVVGTVGPWTITAAGIALDLNLLLMIKDLIDAATASTAEQLQSESDKVTEDAKTAGNMALQIGMAAVGEAGGEALMSTKFGQGMAAGMRDIGEGFGIVKPGAVPVVPEGGVPAGEGPHPTAAPEGAPPPTAEPAAPKTEPAAPKAEPAAAPEPAAPKTEPAAPKAEPAAPEPAAPKAEPAAPKGEPAAPEGQAPEPAAKPGAEEPVAQHPTADGHTVKVNEQGECLVCSDCVKLKQKVEADLANSEVPPAEEARIKADADAVEQIADPEAKAKAGADVQAEVKEAVEEAKTTKEKPTEGEPASGEDPAKEAARNQLKKQAEVKKLLKRIESKGLPGTEAELLDYIAEDPPARIAEINKAIDAREAIAEAQTGVPTEAREPLTPVGEEPPAADVPLTDRVNELHEGILDPIAEGQRTTAVLTTDGPNVVGAGAEQDLTPRQRGMLEPGEVPAASPGDHAEITALKEADARGLTPSELEASRDFCDGCRAEIQARGGTIIGPRRAVFPHKH